MKTAEEIIRQSSQTDFQNGSYKAIVSIDKIEKWMKTYAKQESEKAVREYKNKLIDELDSGISLDTSYVYYAELVGLIEKLK